MGNMDIVRLIEILQTALEKEGNLGVVTTGHYGEPYEYYEDDFHVRTVGVNEGIMPVKPRRVFNIEHRDIGPEPD